MTGTSTLRSGRGGYGLRLCAGPRTCHFTDLVIREATTPDAASRRIYGKPFAQVDDGCLSWIKNISDRIFVQVRFVVRALPGPAEVGQRGLANAPYSGRRVAGSVCGGLVEEAGVGALGDALTTMSVERSSPDGSVSIRISGTGHIDVFLREGALAGRSEQSLERQINACVRLVLAARTQAYQRTYAEIVPSVEQW
ncbi:hypothetical protein Adu01nite_47920 [Paractinoplanes durhamensis]|uniref:Uncharacterized protein n=1 Tax=Paractinoplanes durhamensis TaxID=113563 RepID=A0ABQ3Z0T2_9ACTN|nr:hypothetical protein Adu01nite_47920 [Actinoplanes durhamensis]